MTFIAKLEYYCMVEDKVNTDTIVLSAASYQEATGKIEDVYGTDLESLHLEAIGDGELVYVPTTAEKLIRDDERNTF